jgi:hypothetical protein
MIAEGIPYGKGRPDDPAKNPCPVLSRSVPTARLPGHRGAAGLAKSFRKSAGGLSPEDAERAWFARLLWRAFPEARSENELADLAAEALTSGKRPVTARSVRNWLRCENTPHFRYVLQVVAMAGA